MYKLCVCIFHMSYLGLEHIQTGSLPVTPFSSLLLWPCRLPEEHACAGESSRWHQRGLACQPELCQPRPPTCQQVCQLPQASFADHQSNKWRWGWLKVDIVGSEITFCFHEPYQCCCCHHYHDYFIFVIVFILKWLPIHLLSHLSSFLILLTICNSFYYSLCFHV